VVYLLSFLYVLEFCLPISSFLCLPKRIFRDIVVHIDDFFGVLELSAAEIFLCAKIIKFKQITIFTIDSLT